MEEEINALKEAQRERDEVIVDLRRTRREMGVVNSRTRINSTCKECGVGIRVNRHISTPKKLKKRRRQHDSVSNRTECRIGLTKSGKNKTPSDPHGTR